MDKKPYLLKDLLLLTLVISLLFCTFLGSRALMVPDEGRYAEIPREMVISKDYLTPHLANLKYFEKPPLYYWITALPIKLFGANEWSLRFPTAMLGLIGCLFVYWLALTLYDRRTALLSAFILSSSTLYCTMSHFLSLDLPLTVFLTICMGCFILGTRAPPGKTRLCYFLCLYIFAALATLTKGLIGFILPGFVIFTWILCANEWRSLQSYYLFRGTLLFLLIAAPWHMLMQLAHPEFFHYYFIEQHFLRYFTNYADRGQPAWFLTAAVVVGFFPWCWFLMTSPLCLLTRLRLNAQNEPVQRGQAKPLATLIKKMKALFITLRKKDDQLFFILWALLVFLFFNASNSLLLSYALPIMPPLAILTARYLSAFWENGYTSALNMAFLGIFISGLGGSMAAFILVEPMEITQRPAFYWDVSMGLLGVGMLATIFFYWQKGLKAGVIALFVATSLTLISLNLSYETLDDRPIKSLALQLKPLITPDTQVIAYREYYQDLPVYLGRTVQLVAYRGELDFGIDHQKGESIIWDEATLWKHWQADARVFMIASLQDYERLKTQPDPPVMCLLGQTTKNVLLVNHSCSQDGLD